MDDAAAGRHPPHVAGSDAPAIPKAVSPASMQVIVSIPRCGCYGKPRRYWSGSFERKSSRRRNGSRSEEHTSELQSHVNLVCRLLLEKKKKTSINIINL